MPCSKVNGNIRTAFNISIKQIKKALDVNLFCFHIIYHGNCSALGDFNVFLFRKQSYLSLSMNLSNPLVVAPKIFDLFR
jgi:hypothetical protein